MGKNFMTTLFNKPTRKWFKGAGDTIRHTGERVLDKGISFAEHQTETIAGIFSSPTFLIVAGVVVIGFIYMKTK